MSCEKLVSGFHRYNSSRVSDSLPLRKVLNERLILVLGFVDSLTECSSFDGNKIKLFFGVDNHEDPQFQSLYSLGSTLSVDHSGCGLLKNTLSLSSVSM